MSDLLGSREVREALRTSFERMGSPTGTPAADGGREARKRRRAGGRSSAHATPPDDDGTPADPQVTGPGS